MQIVKQFFIVPFIALLVTILSIQFLSHTQTETYAEKIVRVTNDYRRENGLATLALNQRLSDAARIHAIDVASLSGHTGSDGNLHDFRAKTVGYHFRTVSENIFASTYDHNEDEALQAWIDSPPHNVNLLSVDSKEMGVYKHLHDTKGYWVSVAVYGSQRD